MTNPGPGERIKTEIDGRVVMLTDTATGITVTNSDTNDALENVSRACDHLGKKLAELRLPPMMTIKAEIHTRATGTKHASLALPEPDPTRYPAEAHAYTVATGLRELMLKLAELHSPQALTHTRRMLGLEKPHTYQPGDRLPDGSTYWGTTHLEIS